MVEFPSIIPLVQGRVIQIPAEPQSTV
jgi:hypothetical protein